MSNLQVWEDKIKAKRMKTPFRGFIKEVASWFNVMFYKNHGLVSRYPETDRVRNLLDPKAYAQEYGDWVEGIGYDFNRSFQENFSRVFINAPKMATVKYGDNENCEFTDTVFGAKNSYLSICIWEGAENVLYSVMCYVDVRNVLNSVLVTSHSENVYFSFQASDSFNIFYSRYIANSNNVWFSTNLIGCSECIFCDDLENQSYCINNEKLDKEAYFQKKAEILKRKERFLDFFSKNTTKPKNRLAVNCNGNGIRFSENIENGFMVTRTTNGRNLAFTDGVPLSDHVYDCFDIGKCDDIYGWMGCGQGCTNMYTGANANACTSIYCSFFMDSCSFCLGCIGLKNKSYCILNKQYTKEEWYSLADRIFAQMDADGTLGDFFPGSMNPFYFNDTMAYLIDDSFTKEEVEKEWYLWRDEAIKVDIPEGADIIETKDLNQYQWYDTDGNWTIQEDILSKVIRDEKGNFYKIVPMELEFLRKHSLPLPEIHWLERIKMGFKFQ